MFEITEVFDEFSGKNAVDLLIDARASREDIEAARAALPESVVGNMLPTDKICLILSALQNLPIASRVPPGYISRFVLP